MAILLLNMRHVPEDEAEEVRELLRANDIAFYETTAGTWRMSLAGIWLSDPQQLPLARRLLDEYQEQRYREARRQYEALREQGRHPTLATLFRENPVRFVSYWGLIILVIYLSLQWFLGY